MPSTQIANIAAGAGNELSQAIGCFDQSLTTIQPDDWTAATISFQVSNNNGLSWGELDQAGQLIVMTLTAGRVSVVPSLDVFAGVTHFKIRSGTAALAVPQGAARKLYLGFRHRG